MLEYNFTYNGIAVKVLLASNLTAIEFNDLEIPSLTRQYRMIRNGLEQLAESAVIKWECLLKSGNKAVQKTEMPEFSSSEGEWQMFFSLVGPVKLILTESCNGMMRRIPELDGGYKGKGIKCFLPDGTFIKPIHFSLVASHETAKDANDGQIQITKHEPQAEVVQWSIDGGATFSTDQPVGLVPGTYTVQLKYEEQGELDQQMHTVYSVKKEIEILAVEPELL